MKNGMELVKLHTANQAIIEAMPLAELIEINSESIAVLAWVKAQKLGTEMQNNVAETKIRIERQIGKFLTETEKHKGGQPSEKNRSHDVTSTLNDLGLSKMQSHRYQKEASVPERKFEQHVAETKENDLELTSTSILKLADKPHVSHNSGENEWYTPKKYIESARKVLGTIDLDPASSEAANKIVKAEGFHSIETNGLSLDWYGRVWMNPPYSSGLIEEFIEKFCGHFDAGNIIDGIVLVNNATETIWFQQIAKIASMICFPKGRIKYWSTNKETSTPLQGQAFLYCGKHDIKFESEFTKYGFCCEL